MKSFLGFTPVLQPIVTINPERPVRKNGPAGSPGYSQVITKRPGPIENMNNLAENSMVTVLDTVLGYLSGLHDFEAGNVLTEASKFYICSVPMKPRSRAIRSIKCCTRASV